MSEGLRTFSVGPFCQVTFVERGCYLIDLGEIISHRDYADSSMLYRWYAVQPDKDGSYRTPHWSNDLGKVLQRLIKPEKVLREICIGPVDTSLKDQKFEVTLVSDHWRRANLSPHYAGNPVVDQGSSFTRLARKVGLPVQPPRVHTVWSLWDVKNQVLWEHFSPAISMLK